ncbi:hypothetical protein C7S16_4994 [Burkholderia thailandensis]|uniref:Uncharacterized protein n=1 Tax=Burkholderia thailandensis TaxID=57975 RepID=A0AAW9CR12_BURTH|nr:hypothetical protein [Burkholderia thailandensis]
MSKCLALAHSSEDSVTMVDDAARRHGLPKMAGAASSRDAGRSGRQAACRLPDSLEWKRRKQRDRSLSSARR